MSRWFTASLIFESVHQDVAVPNTLWEESIVLLRADDEDDARQKAEAIGRQGEHEYDVLAPVPHRLRWTFRHLERVHEIADDTIAEGRELFSRFLDAAQVEALMRPSDL